MSKKCTNRNELRKILNILKRWWTRMYYYNSWKQREMEEESMRQMCEHLKIGKGVMGLTEDDLLVLHHMYGYIFITNKICREEIGFGKTKSAQIFKKLVNLGLVRKCGAGAGTYYMLKDGCEGEIVEEW